jgi:uroporphyrinogen decarboxylase
MHYASRDRVPLYDFNFWDETLPEWHKQGLPESVNRANAHEFFGLDCSLGGGEPEDWTVGVDSYLLPRFEPKILEDDGDIYTQVQSDGAIVRRQRSSVSIPMHVGHTLVDRESWNKLYKPKLQLDTPGRFPADWDRRVKVWCDEKRAHPTIIGAGSLFGWIRDWMGMENIAMTVYDDPAWFEEMVVTVTDLQIACLTKILATGGNFDAASMWEDMCYNAGPLLSPGHFKQYLVPNYRRITDLLHKHGVDVIYLDCDGKIDDLLPLWLEAGVNCMFPIEVGNWADPVRFRRQYGKNLLMMGGFDKHILAKSKSEIDAEIKRLSPLVDEGGYIPFCDHRVPPDVPLENYIYYCDRARQVWGRGVDLKPMPALNH